MKDKYNQKVLQFDRKPSRYVSDNRSAMKKEGGGSHNWGAITDLNCETADTPLTADSKLKIVATTEFDIMQKNQQTPEVWSYLNSEAGS
ncbi:hypothetical protein BB561_000405 [Smittium simulii]|uniref:Hyaluronan/mRNA-binding protein domain-containing protein n=1 Tax=Smittium simulii TaxID=133385 RepID=A0A2T9YZB4_9FUNG|nr:hypothetical protein BB561_000405 [Smittium simulii]